MKRTERHKLKENEVSRVLREAQERFTEHKDRFGTVAVIVLIVAIAAVGYWAWRTRTETRAQVMLTEAISVIQSPVDDKATTGKPGATQGTYPTIAARAEAGLAKFTQVANTYPSTKAGIAARYYAASALAMLGRSSEAAARYQEVVDRAGTRQFYGRMAQLGKIEAHAHAKQYDQAIAAAQALANSAPDDALPRDAVLMELGRVYAEAGKKAEAKQTFDKLVAEFPESPYAEEAKQLITTLT
jgi:tetratricopeptide (TPR) repeat protein